MIPGLSLGGPSAAQSGIESGFDNATDSKSGGVFTFGGINVATGRSSLSTSASASDAGTGNNNAWLIGGVLGAVALVAWLLMRKL